MNNGEFVEIMLGRLEARYKKGDLDPKAIALDKHLQKCIDLSQVRLPTFPLDGDQRLVNAIVCRIANVLAWPVDLALTDLDVAEWRKKPEPPAPEGALSVATPKQRIFTESDCRIQARGILNLLQSIPVGDGHTDRNREQALASRLARFLEINKLARVVTDVQADALADDVEKGGGDGE